jgi:uncharacterized protein YoxC
MDTELLLKIMAVFTGVAAVSLVIMMIAAIGVWRSINALKGRAASFMDEWEPLAKSSQETLDDLRRQSSEVLAKVSILATTSQDQVGKVEALVTQLAETAQKNISRVDETIQKTLERIDNATAAVEQTIRVPTDQLRAVGAGLNAAVQQLLKGKTRNIDRVAADEEMFI